MIAASIGWLIVRCDHLCVHYTRTHARTHTQVHFGKMWENDTQKERKQQRKNDDKKLIVLQLVSWLVFCRCNRMNIDHIRTFNRTYNDRDGQRHWHRHTPSGRESKKKRQQPKKISTILCAFISIIHATNTHCAVCLWTLWSYIIDCRKKPITITHRFKHTVKEESQRKKEWKIEKEMMWEKCGARIRRVYKQTNANAIICRRRHGMAWHDVRALRWRLHETSISIASHRMEKKPFDIEWKRNINIYFNNGFFETPQIMRYSNHKRWWR